MNPKANGFILSRNLIDAVIFDMDGVLTQTARIHAAAWKRMFDEYRQRRLEKGEKEFSPFDPEGDYLKYVDGKPRYEGIRSFLQAQGIDLEYGTPDDEPGKETLCGLGNRKNQLFHKILREKRVEVYPAALRLVKELREKGFKTAVVSSSKNCAAVLQQAGIAELFDTRVDGKDAERLQLKGKPNPDIFLLAAERLKVEPKRAAVVEDAIAGVEAGKRGKFRCVIAVDRKNLTPTFQQKGADAVVRTLAEVKVDGPRERARGDGKILPSALDALPEIGKMAEERRPVVFLDYDGTLTPIVSRPEEAVLSEEMRRTVKSLSQYFTVAVISGRDLPDVRERMQIDQIFYAGSHGFDIAGPEGWRLGHQQGEEFLPILDQSEKAIRERLRDVQGAQVEHKKYSVAVHYRRVAKNEIPVVERAVNEIFSLYPGLRKSHGKKVFEIQPDIEWDKGKAVLWLLKALDLSLMQYLPLYIGDDVTDEDAFQVLKDKGIGVRVGTEPAEATAARYGLRDPEEVQKFLKSLARMAEGGA